MNKPARYLVHFIFFYTCIEGLIVNIFYPSLTAYLIKDVAILLLYSILFTTGMAGRILASPSASRLLLPLFFFSAVIAFYLLLPGIGFLGELVAVKQRLFYIPLMIAGYLFIRSEDDLMPFLTVLLSYAVGLSAFGVYLHFTGPSGLTALGAHYSPIVMTPQYSEEVTQYWRVPATFASAGQFGAYLLFSGHLACGIILMKSGSTRLKNVAICALIAIVLAMLTSGSRAPLILLTASMALLLVFSGKVTEIVAWGLGGYAVLACAFIFLGEGVHDRVVSIADYQHVARFQTTYFGQMFLSSLEQNPMGSGLGIATIAARHFSPSQEVELVESYLGILAVETGVAGLGCFLLVAIALLAILFRLRVEVRNSPIASLWHIVATYVIFAVLLFPIASGIDATPGNLYFWFAIGVLLRIADLEAGRRWMPAALPAARAGLTAPAVR